MANGETLPVTLRYIIWTNIGEIVRLWGEYKVQDLACSIIMPSDVSKI